MDVTKLREYDTQFAQGGKPILGGAPPPLAPLATSLLATPLIVMDFNLHFYTYFHAYDADYIVNIDVPSRAYCTLLGCTHIFINKKNK